MVNTKGGFVNFYPKKIIFTSNKSPEEWYDWSNKDKGAFDRRFCNELGNICLMDSEWLPPADPPQASDVVFEQALEQEASEALANFAHEGLPLQVEEIVDSDSALLLYDNNEMNNDVELSKRSVTSDGRVISNVVELSNSNVLGNGSLEPPAINVNLSPKRKRIVCYDSDLDNPNDYTRFVAGIDRSVEKLFEEDDEIN